MLEAYQKELDKNEVPEEEKVKPEHKKTLKEILGNKEESDIFGEMLAQEGDVELSKRLASGQLTEDDIDELDGHRKSFLDTMEDVKMVKESITNDVVNAYTKNNPELQKVVGLVGLDGYRNIVKEKLARLSIKDPQGFGFLLESVKDKNKFESSDNYKGLDEEVSKLCADRKIKPESYLKAMAIEDPKERSKALKGVVKEGWSNWKKAANVFTFGTWSSRRAELMGSKKEELDLATEVMRKHKADVGEFLAAMTDNDEVRGALAKELIGEKEEKIPVQGFKESKGHMPTTEGYQNKWSEYKSNLDGVEWETLSPADQDQHRNNFQQAQQKAFEDANKNKSGFWGSIFATFFTSFLTNNKNNLN